MRRAGGDEVQQQATRRHRAADRGESCLRGRCRRGAWADKELHRPDDMSAGSRPIAAQCSSRTWLIPRNSATSPRVGQFQMSACSATVRRLWFPPGADHDGRPGSLDRLRLAGHASQPRRARTVHEVANRRHVAASGPVFLTAVAHQLRSDPLGVRWTDGRDTWSTRGLISAVEHASWPILTPGCLVDDDAIAALDDRALGMIPSLHDFIRGSGA